MKRNRGFLKILPIATAAAFSTLLVQAQTTAISKKITVKGSVEFIDPNRENTIILYRDQMSGKAKAVDSVKVNEQNKSFIFQVKQDHPGSYYINAMGWDRAYFWSDANVTVNMRGYDTARYKIKIEHYNYVEGSMDNNFINLYQQIAQLDYRRMVDEYNEQYYAAQHKEKDSAWITYLKKTPRYDSLRVDTKKRMDVLLKVYEGRPVLLYALKSSTGTESSEKYESALQSLDKLIKKYPWLTEAKEAKQKIFTNREMALKIKPGKPVPSISYPDVNGKLSGLEKYKGKYLLIDFWASWCGPCRQAIPKVKELYKQYQQDGFEVVSISIDDNKKAWQKAMEEENMPWDQLLSNNKDETMKQFQFSGVPTLYLIDPAGKIIKSYLGYSAESEADIQSILKNKTIAPAERGQSIPAMGF